MIVEQNDVQLLAFLYGGDDFLRHHQVGTVAHHDVDFAVGSGHFYAQSAGDFISHAGISILDVIALGIAGPPKFVQVAGQAAGCANHTRRAAWLTSFTMPITSPWLMGGAELRL